MIDSPSPSFEMALQEEFKRFYLAGIETGRRLERELMQQTHFEVKASKKDNWNEDMERNYELMNTEERMNM